MPKYRKLPVEIDAIHFDGSDKAALAVMHFIDAGRGGHRVEFRVDEDPSRSYIGIPTLEGTMRANAGDWIIRGIKGELYPCRDDIFRQTYEPIDTV